MLLMLLKNVFLFVCIIWLAIQCYRDLKETLKDNNETFKD
jgi:hypothetical protein